MRKAIQKSPPSLGAKRTCPSCGTKFYDFGKDSFTCPKCETKIDFSDPARRNYSPSIPKKSPAKPKLSDGEEVLAEAEDVIVGDDSNFESAEELDDEDDGVVEDIDVDDDKDQKDY